ncbi:MAG: tRNA preQ1(34) S-adenosylmethionine ribosyltransferase-isomerase QueA [Kangiellaceae bacterium]|jgi:S-adenosylmethionine:tRNA ribosyltransferase-isomerase|nr:tRNA preQ1(34) S-adenosylmethionine ribosyltransferase-isomerase QueA [Kangiellaceae bacterium]
MQLKDFYFELPNELIARFPAEQRDQSRLLKLSADGEIEDRIFNQIVDILEPGDCLILNNTKVIPARLLGQRDSGGKVELLIERVLDENTALTQIKASNSLKPETIICINDVQFKVEGRQSQFYIISSINKNIFDAIDECGHVPLPPYIDREDTEFDESRYQTVYAEDKGSVAAPTAGLHFTDELLSALEAKGVNYDFVTLHVGSGTFSPVRVDDIKQHEMHTEWYQVPQSVVDLIDQTKARGKRVVAVGTTSVRSLESAAAAGQLTAVSGDTNIFIYPGFKFKVIDALITNFHLPESTLIMLVSAFSGKDHILKAYQHAVENKYRFFSYGDAMFLERNDAAADHQG